MSRGLAIDTPTCASSVDHIIKVSGCGLAIDTYVYAASADYIIKDPPS